MRNLISALMVLNALWIAASNAQDLKSIERGKYLFQAADCRGCHGNDENELLSGGRALKTPFGVFYATNITADRVSGIGQWSDEDFRNALRNGVAPGGKHLFPVFPYPSYSGLSDSDIQDIKNYLWSLPTSHQSNREHEIGFPFGFRFTVILWKMLFFDPGPMIVRPEKDQAWNRGRYLVQAVAHCTECHSPRSEWTGVVDHEHELAGNIDGPDGMHAPNITPDNETGIGTWTAEEIEHLLKTGETPDFDLVSSGMTSVIKGTRTLTDKDRRAIAIYLQALPPIHSEKKKKNK